MNIVVIIVAFLLLLQAKKFVESAPVVLKSNVGKEEAEKLKESLEKCGAEITID